MKKILLLLLLLSLIPTNIFATTPIIEGLDTLKIVKKGLVQVGHWQRTPTVVICEHAPIDRKDVRKALSWWSDRGYIFYHSIYLRGDRSRAVCRNPDPTGYITINLVTHSSRETI